MTLAAIRPRRQSPGDSKRKKSVFRRFSASTGDYRLHNMQMRMPVTGALLIATSVLALTGCASDKKA
ncbi:peptidase M15A, partial [Rhizobium ruizarguesonis]